MNPSLFHATTHTRIAIRLHCSSHPHDLLDALAHLLAMQGLSPEDKAVANEAFKLYEDEPGKILASNLGEVRYRIVCFFRSISLRVLFMLLAVIL